MLKFYSHSSLSTFEQCPYKFKLRYIDKIKPIIEKTIESHLGQAVHSALEWLYSQISQENKTPTIEELIKYYLDAWQETYTSEIKIINQQLTLEHYLNQGVRFLTQYYTTHFPFDDQTLDIEKKVIIEIPSEKSEPYKLWGFIDRLVYNQKKDRYEIHDYKTANSLPTKDKIDNDRQLALYSIAIKESLPEAEKNKEVILVWHFLAYNKKIKSHRTNKELEKLKKEIAELIKKIEATKYFPTQVSRLCDWCGFKDICPEWNPQANSPSKYLENQDNTDDNPTQNPQQQQYKNFNNYPTTKKYIKE
ncbi:PD-(D/E)XK nuclease family protein [Candidatus Pacearchaeota archaeon]|nr:PD-(D/E)XK nuclease family protein [Candidatus Pacearchaeota archaeon]